MDLTIERDVVIEAPVEVVWRTVTEPDQISLWFADRVELEVKPGGRGVFVFEHDDRPDNTTDLVVERVEPPTHFSFRWGEGRILVDFTLTAEGDERTRLRVVETGLDDMAWSDADKQRYAEEHRAGWARHLGRLGVLRSRTG